MHYILYIYDRSIIKHNRTIIDPIHPSNIDNRRTHLIKEATRMSKTKAFTMATVVRFVCTLENDFSCVTLFRIRNWRVRRVVRDVKMKRCRNIGETRTFRRYTLSIFLWKIVPKIRRCLMKFFVFVRFGSVSIRIDRSSFLCVVNLAIFMSEKRITCIFRWCYCFIYVWDLLFFII